MGCTLKSLENKAVHSQCQTSLNEDNYSDCLFVITYEIIYDCEDKWAIFLEFCILLQKDSHSITRARKLLTLDFRQIYCGINKHMDSISIAWVKNNEHDACYQGIFHKLLKIKPGSTLIDLGLGTCGTDTICAL